VASEISEVEADRDSGKPVNFENGCCHTNSPHRGFEVSRRNVIRRGHDLDEAGLGLRQSGGEDVFDLFRFRKPQAGTPKCSASLQKSGLPCTPFAQPINGNEGLQSVQCTVRARRARPFAFHFVGAVS
jgi:hypothetical protein